MFPSVWLVCLRIGGYEVGSEVDGERLCGRFWRCMVVIDGSDVLDRATAMVRAKVLWRTIVTCISIGPKDSDKRRRDLGI